MILYVDSKNNHELRHPGGSGSQGRPARSEVMGNAACLAFEAVDAFLLKSDRELRIGFCHPAQLLDQLD
jgi:hypothetical protein